MAPSAVQVEIPVEIYERARQIATSSERTVESVLIEGLALLFGTLTEIDMRPEVLEEYSDERLWAIVYQRLARPQDARLRELVTFGEERQLTADEQEEMEALIDIVDHQMLLRSEALLLLKQRGHLIESHLKIGA